MKTLKKVKPDFFYLSSNSLPNFIYKHSNNHFATPYKCAVSLIRLTPGAWALAGKSGSHCAGPGAQQMLWDAAAWKSWESSLDSEVEHKFNMALCMTKNINSLRHPMSLKNLVYIFQNELKGNVLTQILTFLYLTSADVLLIRNEQNIL